MTEKFELYNEQKQVKDSDVAEEMAYAEKPYREGRGRMVTKEANLKYGNRDAEEAGREYMKEKLKKNQLLEKINSFEFTKRGVKIVVGGQMLEIAGEIKTTGHRIENRKLEFIESYGTINGSELSHDDLRKIIQRFKNIILEKYLENKDELNKSEKRQKMEEGRQKSLSSMNKLAIYEVLS